MQNCMTEHSSDWLFARWDDVRVFLSVLREGTFSKAGKRLGLEQSTVSRRIQSLEEALGFALFERGRRGPVATDAAERLKEAALRVEAEMAAFTDAAQGVHQQAVAGQVTLALTEELAVHFVVPRVLPELRAKYPELIVNLVTSYKAADLMGREADVALRFFQSARGDLVGKRIATIEMAALASRAYARRARHKPLEELDWVVVEIPGMTMPEQGWLAEVATRQPVLRCSSYQVQLAAIRAGLGVGIGPSNYTRIDSKLVRLPTAPALPRLQLYVLTRRSIRHVKRVAVLMEALERAFNDLNAA